MLISYFYQLGLLIIILGVISGSCAQVENVDDKCFWTKCKSKWTREVKCHGGARQDLMLEENCPEEMAKYRCCRDGSGGGDPKDHGVYEKVPKCYWSECKAPSTRAKCLFRRGYYNLFGRKRKGSCPFGSFQFCCCK